ncbi:MAG: S8 family peptidase [Erythrobacter sp.]|uniref:S8 family peptidase n=1 Tax=Erythrobacter sp. TaxID=1042 RepID=UPI003262FEC6
MSFTSWLLSGASRQPSVFCFRSANRNASAVAPPIVRKFVASVAVCAALSACGGGTGQGVNTLPPPLQTAPTSPPPSPPPPTSFDTAELRRSDGPSFHGAQAAWLDGSTGSGEIIAIVDTGLDTDSPEFTGRLHPESQDVTGSGRGVDPEDDHGTNVALVAAAARNEVGVLGIAFDAQVLALRADMPGSCGADTPQDASLGCVFVDADIARGIDIAVGAGAAVVNLSLGGSAASLELQNAVRRAADAGVVIVAASGNDGLSPDEVDEFSRTLIAAGGDNVIIVGSVNENGDMSDFSNRAGQFAENYIAARGERICCAYDDGELFVENIDGQQFVTLFGGTSFAAPQVAGAVALLAQAFPNLTGQEIAEILLQTARDAGALGTDNVFGTGILDIAAAFEPIGTTSIAGTDRVLALADNFAIGSVAMGDALNGASLTTIVTDRYNRAFTAELGGNTRNAPQLQRLRGAVVQGVRTRAGGNDQFSVAVTVGEGQRAAGLGWMQSLQLTSEESFRARVLAGRVAARISPDMQIGLAISQNASGLVAQLQGSKRNAFQIAPEASGDSGFLGDSEIAIATRREIGSWGLTISAERGRAWLSDFRNAGDALNGRTERRPTTRIAFAADRRWAGFDLNAGATILMEEDTLLGAHFNPLLGVKGAHSLFLDGRVSRDVGRRWQLGASYRAGITRPGNGSQAGSFVAPGSQINSSGWSIDLTRFGVFSRSDSLGMRLSQPLRVDGGALLIELPVDYDYATQNAITGRQSLALTPTGRELIGELGWHAALPIGMVSTSVYYRNQPGHFRDAPRDVGALISLSSIF